MYLWIWFLSYCQAENNFLFWNTSNIALIMLSYKKSWQNHNLETPLTRMNILAKSAPARGDKIQLEKKQGRNSVPEKKLKNWQYSRPSWTFVLHEFLTYFSSYLSNLTFFSIFWFQDGKNWNFWLDFLPLFMIQQKQNQAILSATHWLRKCSFKNPSKFTDKRSFSYTFKHE